MIPRGLAARILAWAGARRPDFIIGGSHNPYLVRWYVTPWRRWRDLPTDQQTWTLRCGIWLSRFLPSVYVHEFHRSDDDRALHDHPWLFNASFLLEGEYTEHTISAGGIHRRALRRAGDWKLRIGPAPHRIELHAGRCWTLFITGPVIRSWGFHCPDGWVDWRTFTAADDRGSVGAGCLATKDGAV